MTTVGLAMLLALTVISARTNTAFAHEGHLFYVGVTVPVERVDASYDRPRTIRASNPQEASISLQ